jgi:hypothetical protein
MKQRIRPLDVMNQIMSRTKRAKNKEQEFQQNLFIPIKESKHFYRSHHEGQNKDVRKFSKQDL